MARIVVAFAAREARRAAAALLEGAGFPVLRICASGNEVMRAFTLCQDGILVCGARFADATAEQVLADLAGRALALVADRPERLALCGLPEEYKLALPAPRSEWLARVEALVRLHEARLQAGKFLAQEHPVEADVVIGAPDSGLDAALGYAQESGIPYGIGFIKNKYVGRTFIQGSQAQRENSVRIKLNAIPSTVAGKRVVLVDDSIVRGTTSARTIRLLREAGAKEVHYRISAPPFIHPCYFGTDIPDEKQLIATGHTVEEINKLVGSDTLGYLSVEHVRQLAIHSHCGFCDGCFTGQYPVDPPSKTMDIVYDKPLSISNPSKKL